MSAPPLGWPGIARLGLVQASIGMIVMLATAVLNRVMVVEYALAASIPAGLVAWHYAVQLARPLWGHGSDRTQRRTPWIVGGMGVLAVGALLAVDAAAMTVAQPLAATLLAIIAFTMIGAGVGAAGTSLLALLAARVVPERRAAAAAVAWIMMVGGIAGAAGIAGALLDPFSAQRLALVAGGIALLAFLLTLAAIAGVERGAQVPPVPAAGGPGFGEALAETLADPVARRFTLFVFVSMLAYSMQDLILEPFAGLVFAMSPGQSTQLSGMQHGGVLAGMIAAGIGGSAFAGRTPAELRCWIVGGCLGSGVALLGLVLAAQAGPGWPIAANVVALGFMNGLFAVAAIGAMMGLAGAGRRAGEGMRMGVWGAAQAIAFGLGGLTGAVGVDIARGLMAATEPAFALIFAFEAGLFLLAAMLALGVTSSRAPKGLAHARA
ncbi:MAG: BCD family MFS transporter [Sphingomonadaceae bacterium]